MSTVPQPVEASRMTLERGTPARSAAHRTSAVTAATSAATFDIVRDCGGFSALEAEWRDLQALDAAHQHCFQSHGWLSAWLDTCRTGDGAGAELAIITARTAGRLRVVCPFVVVLKCGLRHLTWAGGAASQYGDILTDASSGAENFAAAAIQFAIEALAPDVVDLAKVRSDAAISGWLRSVGACAHHQDEAAFLDFRATSCFEAYCGRFTAKARKNRRRLRRRLEEGGAVTITILPPGPEAGRAIATALRFKQQWLVDRGQISRALGDSRVADFLETFASRPDPVAQSFVSVMQCGTRVISVQFGLLVNRRLALHMIAYNPETEKTGAGVLHIEDTIRHAIESGLLELDLLAPSAAYKQAWADASTTVADYIVPYSLKGRLFTRLRAYDVGGACKYAFAALPLMIRRRIAQYWIRGTGTGAVGSGTVGCEAMPPQRAPTDRV